MRGICDGSTVKKSARIIVPSNKSTHMTKGRSKERKGGIQLRRKIRVKRVREEDTKRKIFRSVR